MPHPILKKTQGSSTPGPRPTARFISPHESEKETELDDPVGSKAALPSPSPAVETTKPDKKTSGPVGGKKKSNFVASTAANKKRPGFVRRQSSQSSAEPPYPGGSTQSSSQRTPPTALEQSSAQKKSSRPSKIQGSTSPSRQPSFTTTSQKGQSSSDAAEPRRGSAQKVSSHNGQSSKSQGPGQEAGDRLRVHSAPSKPAADEKGGREDGGGVRKILVDVKATSPAPTLTTAAGQVNLEGSGVGNSRPSSRQSHASSKDKGKGREGSDLFTKRPVQPTGAADADEPVGSLARSKSQLTLLLEKDRARGSEKTSPRKKKH